MGNIGGMKTTPKNWKEGVGGETVKGDCRRRNQGRRHSCTRQRGTGDPELAGKNTEKGESGVSTSLPNESSIRSELINLVFGGSSKIMIAEIIPKEGKTASSMVAMGGDSARYEESGCGNTFKTEGHKGSSRHWKGDTMRLKKFLRGSGEGKKTAKWEKGSAGGEWETVCLGVTKQRFPGQTICFRKREHTRKSKW